VTIVLPFSNGAALRSAHMLTALSPEAAVRAAAQRCKSVLPVCLPT